MPYQNGTGPMGAGPRTGRGLGPCGAGYVRGSVSGRGFGQGFGRGRIGGYGPYQESVTDETKSLEAELKEIKERLTELKAK